VGSALVEALSREGHRVARLVRSGSAARGPGDVRWDQVSGEFDATAAEGAEAVVHLAGAPLAESRWNDARKRVLRSSRVEATRHLVSALAKLSRPPQVFVSASAIGYYGNCGEEELTEESASGNDFLAELARDWEAEAARAAQFGARTAFLRFGIILSPHGGALARMLTPFRLGLGGRLGPGTQWMSWLTREEAVGIIRFALSSTQVRGAVNSVSPHPVRNAEFTRVLGKTLRRPTIFPAPAFALRLALGEMADVALLTSQRVLPRKLQQLGYGFRQPELEPALAVLLAAGG
jgi:uncharacterized protein (TIGR01777 family)